MPNAMFHLTLSLCQWPLWNEHFDWEITWHWQYRPRQQGLSVMPWVQFTLLELQFSESMTTPRQLKYTIQQNKKQVPLSLSSNFPVAQWEVIKIIALHEHQDQFAKSNRVSIIGRFSNFFLLEQSKLVHITEAISGLLINILLHPSWRRNIIFKHTPSDSSVAPISISKQFYLKKFP